MNTMRLFSILCIVLALGTGCDSLSAPTDVEVGRFDSNLGDGAASLSTADGVQPPRLELTLDGSRGIYVIDERLLTASVGASFRPESAGFGTTRGVYLAERGGEVEVTEVRGGVVRGTVSFQGTLRFGTYITGTDTQEVRAAFAVERP